MAVATKTSPWVVAICLLCVLSHGFAASPPETERSTAPQAGVILKLRLQANTDKVCRGVPILLKVTLSNVGLEDCGLVGRVGWGRGMGFKFRRENQEARWFPRDVPHVDTDLGPMSRPIYFFTGWLNAGHSQELVQMIHSTDMITGTTYFQAWMRIRTTDGLLKELESPEIAVAVVETNDKGKYADALLDEQVWAISRSVAACHNRRRTRASYRHHEDNELVAVAENLLELGSTSLLAEYAIYAAVLQELAPRAAPEDIAFAQEAAKALFERFPESWLRAHVYAAMFEIDPERAKKLIENPFDLPGAELLFDNLGILDDVKKAVGIEEQEDEKEEDAEQPPSVGQEEDAEETEPE